VKLRLPPAPRQAKRGVQKQSLTFAPGKDNSVNLVLAPRSDSPCLMTRTAQNEKTLLKCLGRRPGECA
jgi:hypothetical protein